MSRADLAEAASQWLYQHTSNAGAMDERYIGKLERGAVRWPGRDYRAALRAILGAERDADLGLRSTRHTSNEPTDWPALHRTATTDDLHPWELVDSLTRGTVSKTALEQAERVAVDYAHRYPSASPPELLPDVSRLMRRMNDVLNHPQPIRARQQAVSTLGLLSGLSGNLWLDLGNTSRADSFFDAAELAAWEAADCDLSVWILATRSVAAYFDEDYTTANRHLDRAGAMTERSSQRRCAWVAALHARASAARQHPREAQSALDRAYQSLANISDPPAGTDFFDRVRLDAIAGTVHLQLSDTDHALPLLASAVTERPLSDAKGRTLASLDLAHCHTADAEPEEAARLAGQALETARGSIVRPILIKARGLHHELSQWSDVRAVREFNTQLTALSHV